MMPDFEFSFYIMMVSSIIAVFWLEALFPLERDNWDFEHLGRNFIIWLLAFITADYLIAYYWIDIQSIIRQQSFGLFYWFSLPADWMLLVIGVLLVDLSDYLYHRLSHHSRLLWRLHAVHHTDTRLDVSTTLRAHPLELVTSNFWKFGFALLFGVPIWIIGFRELLIFPLIFLQHANVALPTWLERAAATMVVTPSIHRLHHSIIRKERDNNYGEGLIVWDKLFGSFLQPDSARPEIYGIENCTDEKYQTLDGMIMTPLTIFKHPTQS